MVKYVRKSAWLELKRALDIINPDPLLSIRQTSTGRPVLIYAYAFKNAVIFLHKYNDGRYGIETKIPEGDDNESGGIRQGQHG